MRRPSRVLLAVSLAVALCGGLGSAAQARPAATGGAAPSPVVRTTLPAQYDPVAEYEAQAACDPKPKPGTKALAELIRRTYGRHQVIGISRGCGIGGTSEHKEGRALDWMTSSRNRSGMANARAFLAWLLGPDATGVPYGNATRLGVMYIGWNDHFWAAYDAASGWTELKGCFSRPGRANDTDCHRNHIHISLSWDGASGRTSMWDGTVLTAYCATAWGDPGFAAPSRSPDVVPIAPVRVLSTREGVGVFVGGYGNGDGDYREDPLPPVDDPGAEPAPEPTPEPVPAPITEPAPEPTTPPMTEPPAPPAPAVPTTTPGACRVHAGGWRGDQAGIRTVVVGLPGMPETGVVAVAVTVTALGSTAPARITVHGPGEKDVAAVARVRMNRRATGSAVVPVASDGTITLSTSAGATDLEVIVTGYLLAGDKPNTTVVTPSSKSGQSGR